MRRVLIVSPHFPPVNAADHQRVRMSLPYLPEFGWQATVLAVQPDAIEGATLEPLLEATIPAGTQIFRVSAVSPGVARKIRVGSLAMRALLHLWRGGNRLLARGSPIKGKKPKDEAFDLVFFSTTQFAVMRLGPVWKRRFKVPYVVDVQDPWLDHYYERTNTPPPGGWVKYRLSQLMARQFEPRVMRNVSQVISVSPAYVETLLRRYPHLGEDRFTTLPFGAAEHDFEVLESLNVKQEVFDPADGRQHWVYVGRGGRDMACALRLLFQQLAALRVADPTRWTRVRLHFIGTSYAPTGRGMETVKPIAAECDVPDLVEEQTARVPYFTALRLLRDAHALVVVGSDSTAYTPSKLATYLFARKPLLAILRQDSPGTQLLRNFNGANLVTFVPESGDDSLAGAAQALQQTFVMAEAGSTPYVDQQEIANYSAREMTRRLCKVFDKASERRHRQ